MDDQTEITLGLYTLIHTGEIIEVEEIDEDRATLLNQSSGFRKTKTLHWCRKHLEPKG